ncbi:MAG TPA: diacylglycerol kinase family lipid kinase [bacterium]|nr:diacylglycerol kinase family lipid kinase [bacterium]
MTARTLHAIVNPAAAGGRLKTKWEPVADYFHHQGIAVCPHFTREGREAAALAKTLIEAGERDLAAAGGDGTAFEVINGILSSGAAGSVRFGILPLGTGNSFLRDFDIRDWRTAAARIVAGKTRPIDVGRVTWPVDGSRPPLYFHNMLGLGLMAEACRLRHGRFGFMGRYAYHAAFFNQLMIMKNRPATLCLEGGKEFPVRVPLLAVCNSQFTGHDMRLSPHSRVDDGRFDLLYAENISPLEILKLFLQLPQGTHLRHPKVRVAPFSEGEIEMKEPGYIMMDGEVIEAQRIRVEVLPGALQVMV